MRLVAFKKGTLVVSFPDRIAQNPINLEMKMNGCLWAVTASNPNETIIGAGTYRQDGPDIHVSGGEVEKLPEWWEHGTEVSWRSAVEVAAFGRSDTVIPIQGLRTTFSWVFWGFHGKYKKII